MAKPALPSSFAYFLSSSFLLLFLTGNRTVVMGNHCVRSRSGYSRKKWFGISISSIGIDCTCIRCMNNIGMIVNTKFLGHLCGYLLA